MPDKKISELEITQSITGDDVSVLVRNGTDYQYAFSKLITYLSNNISTGNSVTFISALPQDTTGKNNDVAINATNGSFYQKRNGGWALAYSIPVNETSTGGAILYGIITPTAATGQINDTYIHTVTGEFYQKQSSSWQKVFTMQSGPPGGPGPKGDQGIPGFNGKSVLNGTINPSNTNTGTDGDFYINTTTWQIFGPKTAGNWGAGKEMTQEIDYLGNLSILKTETKTDLVSAINEVLEIAEDVDLSVPSWTVYGSVPFGKYSNGEQVPAAESAYYQYKEAYTNVAHPNYIAPLTSLTVTAKLAGTSTNQPTSTIEVGQVLDFTASTTFTKNDAGNATALSITKKVGNGATNEIGTTEQTADNGYTIINSSIVYQATYNYLQGPIKNNELNQPDPVGRIPAGIKSASSTITPRYKIFYGAIPSGLELTSDLLRGISGGGSISFIWENGNMPISLNTGTTHRKFFVATRIGNSKTLTTAKDVQTNGDVKSIYQSGKITMSIKNGGTGDVTYDVYVYEQAVAYGEAHTHELTLS
ncbi:hypothetical protein [Mucilaginibacter terrae]|uniref:Collagen-like protein n=1 Tax=Mucilaginibacter terrae TaxID=1955052 RepID=A0ABU3H1F2_9SPHI|nr:hypothetical protein [Mucilaginibacter terrae]MDT3405097.1 hypothetical protein [Mucilaginibacter terrae]